VIQIDIDNIDAIQEERGLAIDRLVKAVSAGILTANEAREELGYAPNDEEQIQTPTE
jgi:phage portal protein BeeE